jgi:hypothetical protein
MGETLTTIGEAAAMWSFLFGRRARSTRSDLRLVLYTRKGCHLCDDALEVVEKARRKYGFGLEVVDIDTSPELVAVHGNWVPVVAVNGTVRFRGGVNRVLLERILHHAAG